MNAELVLTQLLRLNAAVDSAIEHGVPVGDDALYSLVGLVEALDTLLTQGALWPRRWAKSAERTVVKPTVSETSENYLRIIRDCAPSNDNAIRVRRERVRRTRYAVAEGQLALFEGIAAV